MAIGRVPEGLDAVYVIAVPGKQFGVVDAQVVKFGHTQHIINPKAAGLEHFPKSGNRFSDKKCDKTIG